MNHADYINKSDVISLLTFTKSKVDNSRENYHVQTVYVNLQSVVSSVFVSTSSSSSSLLWTRLLHRSASGEIHQLSSSIKQ